MTKRVLFGLLGCICIACSDDVSVGAGADPANAAASLDVHVTVDFLDVVVDAKAPNDAQPAGLPTWLTGTWLECGGSLAFAAPDQAVWRPLSGACTVTAHVVWDNGALVFDNVVSEQCTGAPPVYMTPGTHATFDGAQLSLIHTKIFGGIKRFAQTANRQDWSLTADKGGIGHLRLCYDAEGRFYDGNWRSENCSLIACGSVVSQVKIVGAETHIWTQCQGDCPCTSILIVTEKSDKAMKGKYSSGSCQQPETGTFDALFQPIP